MIKTLGYAAHHSFTSLKPYEFEREEPKANEIEIDVLFCGVCHSDIHQCGNDWMNTVYPCVPGHEVVGRVKAVGSSVTKHAIGDVVGVGCMMDSCGQCEACKSGEENYCEGPNSWLATYNGPMVPSKKAATGTNMYGRDNTFGGYSTSLVVREDFVLKIPASIAPEKAAPLLCAGVTTYSPIKHFGVKAGQTVGVVGFGGLGHLAAQYAKALGAKVTIFTHNEEKVKEAPIRGYEAVLDDQKESVAEQEAKFDFIIDTIPSPHDTNPYIKALKRDGTLVVVGALGPLPPVNNMEVAAHRKRTAGSLIGGIAETQEMLEFSAEHNIAPEIEIISMEDINDAYKRVNDGDVRYRFVIDMASLKKEQSKS